MPDEKDLSQEEWRQLIIKVLEGSYWLQDIDTMTRYTRTQDDHNGTFTGKLTVIIGGDGDAHVWTDPPKEGGALRFRNYFGGGLSLRVRNALVILAQAIMMDNKERPESAQ